MTCVRVLVGAEAMLSAELSLDVSLCNGVLSDAEF